MPFPDESWCAAAIELFNADPDAPEATAGWQGDFGVVIDRQGGPLFLYIGVPAGGRLPRPVPMDEPALRARAPAYQARATEADWRALVLGELDPIAALVQRRLVAQGDLQQVIARLHLRGLAERWLERLRPGL
jgi:hypothetical protein